MLAITQFEVYAFAKGRWTLHARYPSEERQQAILDARTTESATGFPTKVLRETYFPEINNSETITAYISPKAKAAQRRSTAKPTPAAGNVLQAASDVTGQSVRRTNARPQLTTAQAFFRILVAAGMSLGAATLTTGIVAWALSWIAGAGVNIDPNTRATLVTYAYGVMFLFFLWSLYRSRLPLHRALADLWQKASAKAQGPLPTPAMGGKPPRVKPKHDNPPSPETLREWEDLKLKRGDIDTTKPPEIPEVPAAVVAIAPPVNAVPPPQPDKKPAEKAAEKPVPEKLTAPVEPPPVLEVEKTAEIKKKEKAAAEAALAKNDVADADDLNLERMVMRRFAVDVVKPAIKSTMPDDPVARRGATVVLAGGAAGVAATARVGGIAELELLTDALRHIGMNQASVDTFMSQHTQLVSAPANAALLAAGRTALAAYLEGGVDIVTTLARALTNWRAPFGQTYTPFATAFSAAEILPLIDIYMMTELRETGRPAEKETLTDAFHDQAMGAHNNIVRHAIAVHGGHEVKHTGKGIFARFYTASTAVDAATSIQRQFAPETSKIAIGIIGNNVTGEDPILSANLIRQAQAILARAGAGEILCEAKVRAATLRQQSSDPGTAGGNDEDLDLVRLSITETDIDSSQTDASVAFSPPQARQA